MYRAQPLDFSLLRAAHLPWGYATYKLGSKASVVGAPLCLHCVNSWLLLGQGIIICGEKISFARLCPSCIWTNL